MQFQKKMIFKRPRNEPILITNREIQKFGVKMEGNYSEKYKRFYNSKEWIALRNYKYADADGFCEECKKQGIVKPGVDVHHIVPIEIDWSKRLDYNNLILLCKECHNEKHERGGSLSEFLKIWEE